VVNQYVNSKVGQIKHIKTLTSHFNKNKTLTLPKSRNVNSH